MHAVGTACDNLLHRVAAQTAHARRRDRCDNRVHENGLCVTCCACVWLCKTHILMALVVRLTFAIERPPTNFHLCRKRALSGTLHLF